MDQEARMVEPVRDGRSISDEPSSGIGRLRQAAIYRAGVYGRRPKVPTSWPGLEAKAQAALSRRAWAYVAGGAGLESTIHANADGFERWRIVPRVLHDVGHRYLTIELFGRVLPAPLLLGPVGALSLVHGEADLAVARAAASRGVPMVFSNQASVLDGGVRRGDGRLAPVVPAVLVDVGRTGREPPRSGRGVPTATRSSSRSTRRCSAGDHATWTSATCRSRTARASRSTPSDPVFRRLVEERAPRRPARAAAAAHSGRGAGTARHGPGVARVVPDNLRSPLPRAAVETFLGIYSRPSITWADLAWLRSRTRLPIVLKGVLHPDDARRALDEGVDGVVVSTHGGRQVDRSIAALDALPDVVAAVDERAPVLLDSGIRSGADMVKAVALGAQAVLLGRPFVWGLALGGRRACGTSSGTARRSSISPSG